MIVGLWAHRRDGPQFWRGRDAEAELEEARGRRGGGERVPSAVAGENHISDNASDVFQRFNSLIQRRMGISTGTVPDGGGERRGGRGEGGAERAATDGSGPAVKAVQAAGERVPHHLHDARVAPRLKSSRSEFSLVTVTLILVHLNFTVPNLTDQYLKSGDCLVVVALCRGLRRGLGAVEQHDEVHVEGGEPGGVREETENAGQNTFARGIL